MKIFYVPLTMDDPDQGLTMKEIGTRAALDCLPDGFEAMFMGDYNNPMFLATPRDLLEFASRRFPSMVRYRLRPMALRVSEIGYGILDVDGPGISLRVTGRDNLLAELDRRRSPQVERRWE